LLQFPEPAAEQRVIPCPCSHQARYRELRSRRLLTALGEVELWRPWYLCPHCHNGQYPLITNSTSKTATALQVCAACRP
jgi:hypothetical protein